MRPVYSWLYRFTRSMSDFNATHPPVSHPPLRLLERPVRAPRAAPPPALPLIARLVRLASRWRTRG
jgi:hypothetical protein